MPKIMDGVIMAGAARADITTEDKGVRIHDPLYAKVLAVSDGNTRLVIIGMDTTAVGGRFISGGILADVSEDFLIGLRAGISKEFGIPGCNVLVNASHTHPPGNLLCGDDEQLSRVLEAVKRAFHGMSEARIGSGKGYEDRIVTNRTLRLHNGRHWTVRNTNPCPQDSEVAGLGPVDPDIGIVRVDRIDGTPLAVVYNYACHPLAGVPGGAVSAYFPGFASGVIEDVLGCGATAIFLQGAAGDIMDAEFKDHTHPRNTETMGMMLGLSVLNARRGIQTADRAALRAVSESLKLPLRKDFEQRIKELARQQSELLGELRFTSLNMEAFIPLYVKCALKTRYPSNYAHRYMHDENTGSDARVLLDEENRANMDKYISNIKAMEQLARIQDDIETIKKQQAIARRAGGGWITTEILGMKIGDCVIISSPAELLAEIGMNIKKASPYEKTFVSAFSNGYIHYGPPASYYEKGGYEVTECLLAASWQKIFEQKAHEIICSV